MHHSESVTIDTNKKFELEYRKKIELLLMSEPVNRGPAHATTDDTMASTHELMHVTESFSIDEMMGAWQVVVNPNLPWAEDHFRERVGGQPLNPSPSEAWWPYARQGNAEHKQDQVFSHTYPERFWPKHANMVPDYHDIMSGESEDPVTRIPSWDTREGIRYPYGDLTDLVRILAKNINSRQAYLPIWFPEDLAAARMGLRVPCSMGYHFIMVNGKMDCVYTMRSCDIVRFYRDDIYMAGRLLQWVCEAVGEAPGKLVVHIDNLHCFPGDRPFLEPLLASKDKAEDPRTYYNFGALG